MTAHYLSLQSRSLPDYKRDASALHYSYCTHCIKPKINTRKKQSSLGCSTLNPLIVLYIKDIFIYLRMGPDYTGPQIVFSGKIKKPALIQKNECTMPRWI